MPIITSKWAFNILDDKKKEEAQQLQYSELRIIRKETTLTNSRLS
jgi:hypothetical protein